MESLQSSKMVLNSLKMGSSNLQKGSTYNQYSSTFANFTTLMNSMMKYFFLLTNLINVSTTSYINRIHGKPRTNESKPKHSKSFQVACSLMHQHASWRK